MSRGNIFSVYAMIALLLLSLVVFAFMIVPQGPEKQTDRQVRQVTVIRYDSHEDAKKGLAEHLGITVEELERQDRSNLDHKEEEE